MFKIILFNCFLNLKKKVFSSVNFVQFLSFQYCAQIWLGKYDSKSGEADFSTPDKRREFMRLKYEEKKFYVDPREAIKKMKPPGPVAPTSALLLSLSPKATL